MRVLGIETSCDDTGVALYDSQQGLLAHLLYSQVKTHAEYGGVVPELAARDHVVKVLPLVDALLEKAGVEPPKLFKDLVKAGTALEKEARVSSRSAAGSVEDRINRVRENFGIHRFGLGDDLSALHKKVDALDAKLDLLTRALEDSGVIKTPKKPAKKKAATKKAPAKKAAAKKSATRKTPAKSATRKKSAGRTAARKSS